MITAFVLLVLSLAGWTIATLLTKGEYQEAIKEELSNMLETIVMLASSIKNLIKTLIKSSFSVNSAKETVETEDNVISISDSENKEEDVKVA